MALGKACPYKITITPSHNMGFTMNIGCYEGVYPDGASVLGGISRYLGNPEAVEKEYNEKCGDGDIPTQDIQEDCEKRIVAEPPIPLETVRE